MIAHIITIGDEILIGQTVDTNSAWLGKNLNAVGVQVEEIISISDDPKRIKETLKRSEQKADLVIITGGLGPTNDDLTKQTLSEYFGASLVRNQEVLQKIEAFFAKFNRPVLEVNRMQADLPDNCEILPNAQGTASGMLWDRNKKVVVSLPGVPYEMRALISDSVLPYLKKKYPSNLNVAHRVIITGGIGESALADLISGWEKNLHSLGFKLAYLPNPGSVKLRISYYGTKRQQEIQPAMDLAISELKTLIPDYFLTVDDKNMVQVIADMLTKQGKTLGVVESCTGGQVANLFTVHPGCSDYFKGGIIAYNESIKVNVLGIPAELIKTKGVVSESVAEQMAIKGQGLLNVDYCIATTGVAGPGGGSEEIPVGTVCTAVVGSKIWKKTGRYGNTRNRVIERASTVVITELLKMLQEDFVN